MAAFIRLAVSVLTSKKALATIAGVVIVATNKVGLDLPEEAVTQIIAAIAAYVVSQGLADFSKNAVLMLLFIATAVA